MHDLILALLACLMGLFAPGTGTRRAGSGPVSVEAAGAPRTAPAAPRLPAHRSPYGREERFDDPAGPLVRPYLVRFEENARRQRRRLALVLAADFGVDLDARVPHGAGADR
ncbi:hypothetical protein AB0A99_12090 [Streptomyces fradiae]|uniref:hypothetical protein n=1 Tax=Streptomyces fradiae TaxID=1906 RepID=UPI0033D9AD10